MVSSEIRVTDTYKWITRYELVGPDDAPHIVVESQEVSGIQHWCIATDRKTWPAGGKPPDHECYVTAEEAMLAVEKALSHVSEPAADPAVGQYKLLYQGTRTCIATLTYTANGTWRVEPTHKAQSFRYNAFGYVTLGKAVEAVVAIVEPVEQPFLVPVPDKRCRK